VIRPGLAESPAGYGSLNMSADPRSSAPDPAELLARLAERERVAQANGIEIAYDELGDPDGEPMVLAMGLGTQLIHWDEGFCAQLGERGYRVIRFDNRDAGHSTKIEGDRLSAPTMLLGIGEPAYKLRDMADDVAGLLDHLEIERAHVVGASMGGMIAQAVAIGHPDRILSLASMMSSTGNRRLGLPRLRAFGALLSAPPRDREAYAERVVKTFQVIGSPDFPMDEERVRALALAAFDRCFYPRGVARQLHAITSSRERTRRLGEISVPTVVIHGTEDPLVRPAAGRATAKAIPGSHLCLIEGMGHDLPRVLWPRIADQIDRNARRGAPAGRPLGAAA
jgi:pimeloyl-ACP methyl ester carboxylesterase